MSDASWDQRVYTQDYIAVAYSYLVLTIMILITIAFVRKLYKHRIERTAPTEQQTSSDIDAASVDDGNNIQLITRISIVAIFLYLLSVILIAILLTKWILVDQQHGIPLNGVLSSVAIIPYSLNTLCFLFFILAQRLNGLLGSKCLHITSYVLPAVSFSIIIIGRNILMYTMPGLNREAGIVNSLVGFCILLIYFVFAVIYSRQITKIIQIRAEMNMNLRYAEMTQEALGNNEKETTNKQDEVIVTFGTVQDVVRCALLVMICALSNFLIPILVFIGNMQRKHALHRNTLFFFGLLTDTIFNALCIFLLFRFAESYYFCLCAPCHQCVLNQCINRGSTGFRKKNTKCTHEQYVSLIIDQVDVETEQKPDIK